MRYAHVCLFSLLAACGSNASSDSGGESARDPYTLLIEDAGARPSCDAAHEAQLIYVLSDKEFQTCTNGSWETVDIKGADGADGTNGKDGKDGADGKDAPPVSANYWLDVMKGREWVISEPVVDSEFFPDCDAGWKLADQIGYALDNGLRTAFADILAKGASNPRYACYWQINLGDRTKTPFDAGDTCDTNFALRLCSRSAQ